MMQVQLNEKKNFLKKQIITSKYIEQKILEEDLNTLEDSIIETTWSTIDFESYDFESLKNKCYRMILNSILFDFIDINSLKYENEKLYLKYFCLDNTTIIAENIKEEIKQNRNKKFNLEWKLYSMMLKQEYQIKDRDSFIKYEKYYSFLLSFL